MAERGASAWWLAEIEANRPALVRAIGARGPAGAGYGADDALQDTLVEITGRALSLAAAAGETTPIGRILNTEEPSESQRNAFLAWVRLVARRRLVDDYRRRWREEVVKSFSEEPEGSSEGSSPADTAEAAELLGRLSDGLDRLADEDRELFLRVGDESAPKMPAADRVRLHRLRRQLHDDVFGTQSKRLRK